MSGRGSDLDVMLPCGRRPAALPALVADGRGADAELAAHTRTCAHCLAELEALTQRWQPVRLAAETTTPVPPGLVPRVLASLDGLRGRPHAEPVEIVQKGGRLRIAERVVLLLAWRLATEVMAGYGVFRIETVAADDDGLRVHLSLRYGMPGAEVAALVREQVAAGLVRHLGPSVPAVHVIIEDVLPSFG